MKPLVTSFLVISSTQGVRTTLPSPSLPTSPWQQGEGGWWRKARRTGEGRGRSHQADSAQLLSSFLITG